MRRRPGGVRPGGVLADAALALGAFLLAATVFLRATETTPFHGDESEWIAAGRYFKTFFLDRELSGSFWRPSWLNRDQPPVGRYVIGGAAWASGRDLGNLNKTYAWDKDLETNRQEGRIPPPELLGPVRRAMAVLGALAVVGLYAAGVLLDGRIAGLIAALVVTFSPLVQLYFSQARTEALLALFTVLALVGVLAAARRFARDGRVPPAAWATGLALGLALATKLTAALAIAGTGAYAMLAVAACRPWRRSSPSRVGGVAPASGSAAPSDDPSGDRRAAGRMLAWAAASMALASLVWVAVNPFLYPDPIGRTWSMLEQQSSIMVEQGERFGGAVSAGFVGRVALVGYRTFVENATPAFDANLPPGSAPLVRPTLLGLSLGGPLSAELLLGAVGLALLARRAVGEARAAGRPGAAAALLAWIGVYWLGIAANLSLDWPRYYVPTVFLGSLLIGLAASTAARLLGWLGAARVPRAAVPRERSVGAAS